MVCDTRLKPRQTISERADEVRRATEKLARDLATGKVKPLIGKDGAIAFLGFGEPDRDGVTDGCLYRRIMATGSTAAKMAIARQEQLTGRKVSGQAVASGVHSHDGGRTWHKH